MQVTEAGQSITGVTRLATVAREIQISGSQYGGNGTSTPVAIRTQAACAASMLTRIAQITDGQRSLYLAIGQHRVQLTICGYAVFLLSACLQLPGHHDNGTTAVKSYYCQHDLISCSTSCMHAAGKSKGSVKTQLEGLYSSPVLNITVYQETVPSSRVVQQLGLWDAGNNYIAAPGQSVTCPLPIATTLRTWRSGIT